MFRELAGQAARFGAVGVVNTLVGLAVIFVASSFLGASPVVANACGYAVGILVSFLLNRSWTFRSRSGFARLPHFVGVFAASYVVNLVVLLLLLETTGAPEFLAQVVAMGCYSVTFFALCRIFVFGGQSHPAERKTDGRAASCRARQTTRF